MTKAKEAAIKAWPPRKDGQEVYYHATRSDIRKVYAQGYRKAEKAIISIIESRLSEIIGDAQPKPALRAELQELIDKIKG